METMFLRLTLTSSFGSVSNTMAATILSGPTDEKHTSSDLTLVLIFEGFVPFLMHFRRYKLGFNGCENMFWLANVETKGLDKFGLQFGAFVCLQKEGKC